jgi:hypothetical protein
MVRYAFLGKYFNIIAKQRQDKRELILWVGFKKYIGKSV